MTPREMQEQLDFKARVRDMPDEELAQALWEVRIQDCIGRNSAEETVLDQAVQRLRSRAVVPAVAPSAAPPQPLVPRYIPPDQEAEARRLSARVVAEAEAARTAR